MGQMQLAHRAIIKRLGGHVRLAETLGLHEEAVKAWLKRDRGIPPRYWHEVAELAGLTTAYIAQTKPHGRQRGRAE